MWGHTGLIRATSYTSDVTRHFCIQANRVVVGSRKCPGRRESLPAVGGTGDGWGVRVWSGRGPVHEGVAEAAVVGMRLALPVRKARRKAGRTAVERMSWISFRSHMAVTAAGAACRGTTETAIVAR